MLNIIIPFLTDFYTAIDAVCNRMPAFIYIYAEVHRPPGNVKLQVSGRLGKYKSEKFGMLNARNLLKANMYTVH